MSTQPNILLFVTEQQRGDCLSIEGHPVLLTPNMDSIAGAGARFTHAYTPCPTCIAARRTLLSGQNPATHGMVGYRDGQEWNIDINETLAGAMAQSGYQTAWVGRSIHQHPFEKRFGFEYMVSQSANENSDYMKFIRDRYPDDWEAHLGTGVMHNDWTARPWHLEEACHPTAWTVHEALRFLKHRDTSRPFFLVVSFLAAHPPLIPPAFYFERYLRTGVPDPIIGDWAVPPPNGGLGQDVGCNQVDLKGEALLSARAGYYGLINHMDDHIRRLISPVKGVDPTTNQNTVVMLTSDHGEMLGDHHRWAKSVPYEASARVPLLVRAPKRFGIEAGTVIDKAVGLQDIMPTCLDFAGATIPDSVQGQSLLPLLQNNKDTPWRPFQHIEHSPMHQTLTDGQEKYIWLVASGKEQFFRLTDDPNECHDLSNTPGEADRIAWWRNQLVKELTGRPEGFTDEKQLIPGRPYPPMHASLKA